MANTIDQYINLMAKIEDMIGEISGVTRQRQGSISNRELVGAVERSVIQSSLVTEPLYWTHNQCKKNALRMLLNTAKEAWRNADRQFLQYIYDDTSREFVNLAENFFYEDYDIFVTDSNKAMNNIEMLKSLYQPAMQGGASLLDIAEIMTMDNVTEIKTKLKEIETRKMEMQQQMQDAEFQRQAQLEQMSSDIEQKKLELEEQKMLLDKYKIDIDSQTKITVAEIGAYRFQEDLDANNNNIPDPMEIANVAIKEQQLNASIADKQMQSYMKERDQQNKLAIESKKVDAQKKAEAQKATIEKEKIALEKDRMSHEVKLQKLKDSAALERERLKARTALKNKTSGEKK